MKYILVIYSILTSFIIVSSDSICGNWQNFNDEKCFQLWSPDSDFNFSQALDICKKMDSKLYEIDSDEEQDFITKLLFKNSSVLENVWLGFQLDNSSRIIGRTQYDYINWAEGSPEKRADEKCVQISSETNQRGNWVDEPCKRKGLALCQKYPAYTAANLQTKLLEKQKELRLMKYLIDNLPIEPGYTNFEYSSLFIDDNGNANAFIMPYYNQSLVYRLLDFSSATKLCAKFSANLVEIKSARKQSIFQNAFKELALEAKKFINTWLNGGLNAAAKLEWYGTKTTITYVNFAANNCKAPLTNLIINSAGKWSCGKVADLYSVICEFN